MDLRKTIEGGPSFGEFKTDLESIFERMGRSNRRAVGGAGNIKSAVVDHDNPCGYAWEQGEHGSELYV
jgi:RNA exonuclease 1